AAAGSSMTVSLKVLVSNNAILLRKEKNESDEFSINPHRNKLTLAVKNYGGNWETLSTKNSLAVKTEVYSHLLLTAGINTLGMFAVMHMKENASGGIRVANRMFMPGVNNLCGRTVIGFSNNENESVTIRIYDIRGVNVYQKAFSRMNVFAWDGVTDKGDYARTGVYLVNIIVGGSLDRSYTTHVYAVR
ncbi:MAG TPA: hypothetical protein DC049_15080, partial [Spirochaetia bacterium]|nr:hypothetical protein [Spirochaetia bacterium]